MSTHTSGSPESNPVLPLEDRVDDFIKYSPYFPWRRRAARALLVTAGAVAVGAGIAGGAYAVHNRTVDHAAGFAAAADTLVFAYAGAIGAGSALELHKRRQELLENPDLAERTLAMDKTMMLARHDAAIEDRLNTIAAHVQIQVIESGGLRPLPMAGPSPAALPPVPPTGE